MMTPLAEGFLLGLATGTTCLTTCGPFYVPYLMLADRDLRASLLAVLEMSAGRFITYLIVGAAVGLLGKQIDFKNKDLLTAAAYILLSIFMLITVFRTRQHLRCCRTGRLKGIFDRPLLLGVLAGINICPPFLLALAKVINGSGPIAGMMLFAAFFAGTSLFLVPMSAFGLLGGNNLFRMAARWGAIIVSAWFSILAGLLVVNHFR